MNLRILIIVFVVIATFSNNVFSQKKFLGINDFKEPIGDWYEAGNAKLSAENEKFLDFVEGKGVFINGKDGRTKHFITKNSHGDIKLSLEFLISKNSNSGVYLQGRYEVQVFDSWGVENPACTDCGGIYQRWNTKKKTDRGYDGIPPLVNACKPPGEWQTLFVNFKAPRFNKNGEKVSNAKFKKVVLNGIVVHKNAEATGPTRAALDFIEEPLGPLMLQGDHGPVAYRNIKIKK